MARFDYVGMFWEDKNRHGILHSFDDSWKPRDFPNLSRARVLGVDIETWDPELITRGPGWGYGIGHIVGVSIATEDDAWYFPLRHEVQRELNMDVTGVYNYLRDVLGSDCPKVGANLQYDVGWLLHEGVNVNGPLYDVQYAEALIDDVALSYSLDSISKKYLKTGKVTSALYDWADKVYGKEKDQRKNIYKCPPSLVGPYAEGDAIQPLLILKKQWAELTRLGLVDLFKMECDLLPLLIRMRMQGMRVDESKAEQAGIAIENKIQLLHKELRDHAGFPISANSGKDLSRMFDAHGEQYPRTATGAPSFVKDWLKVNPYKGAQLVYNIRRYEKANSSFIKGAILDSHIDSIVRPSLHPLRGEGGGAVSGRFSCSQPNGQQIPSRDDELAPIIRGIFVPQDGREWLKADYSQIEYRCFAHFSKDKQLIEAYHQPDTDFHDFVGSLLGGNINRTAIKNINFGLLYGMGKTKLTAQLASLSLDVDPEKFLETYHTKFPAAKRIISECSKRAETEGEIRTILNRRNTFELWEPIDNYDKPLPYRDALRQYGTHIMRAGTYKALNRMLQGSAADIMKKSMVELHKSGLLDKIGYPYITVHDELDFGYHPDFHAEFKQVKEIMETSVKLRVPLRVDYELGPNWGNLEDFDI